MPVSCSSTRPRRRSGCVSTTSAAMPRSGPSRWGGGSTTCRCGKRRSPRTSETSIGRAIALEQQKQVLGIGNSSLDDVLKGLAAGFDRWVLQPLLRSAPLGCTEASAAVSAYLEWNRQMQMLGVSLKDALPEEVARATKAERERDLEMRREPPPELLPLAFELCSEENFRRCQVTGDFEGLRSFFLGFVHSTLMFGQEVSRDVITRAHSFLERCGRWDLTLESVGGLRARPWPRPGVARTRRARTSSGGSPAPIRINYGLSHRSARARARPNPCGLIQELGSAGRSSTSTKAPIPPIPRPSRG